MKAILIFVTSLSVFSSAFAGLCRPGVYKECSAKLKTLNQKEKGREFEKQFDVVCMESKKFKCVKKIVRGEVSEEMKYTRDDHPKASLYTVTVDGENYIYIFEMK